MKRIIAISISHREPYLENRMTTTQQNNTDLVVWLQDIMTFPGKNSLRSWKNTRFRVQKERALLENKILLGKS